MTTDTCAKQDRATALSEMLADQASQLYIVASQIRSTAQGIILAADDFGPPDDPLPHQRASFQAIDGLASLIPALCRQIEDVGSKFESAQKTARAIASLDGEA